MKNDLEKLREATEKLKKSARDLGALAHLKTDRDGSRFDSRAEAKPRRSSSGGLGLYDIGLALSVGYILASILRFFKRRCKS